MFVSIFTGGNDGVIKVWNLSTAREILSFEPPASKGELFSYNPTVCTSFKPRQNIVVKRQKFEDFDNAGIYRIGDIFDVL